MRNTRIYIRTDIWRELDMYDDVNVAVTITASDIKDITRKAASHTATIQLPNTPNNARVFDCIHEITRYGQSSFEMLKSYPCYIMKDDRVVLRGRFELNRVLQSGGEYSYEGIAYSTIATIADILGNDKLRGNNDTNRDLDFSDMDLSVADTSLDEIGNRLAGQYDGCGMTLIDKTRMSETSQYTSFYADEITPFLWVRDIFSRIMQRTGYTIQSNFLSGRTAVGGVNFGKLIYPYPRHNDNLEGGDNAFSRVVETGDSVNYKMVTSTTQSANEISLNTGNTFPFPTTCNLNEHGVSSSVTSYNFAVPTTGRYRIALNIPYHIASKFVYLYDGAQVQLLGGEVVTCTRQINKQVNVYVRVRNGNTNLFNDTFTQPFDTEYKTNSYGSAVMTSGTFNYENTLYLHSGDIISFDISMTMRCGIGSGESRVAYLTSDYGELWLSYPEIWLDVKGDGTPLVDIFQEVTWGEGSGLRATNILNPNTTQIGFLSALFRLFNLMAEDNGDGTITIEPYPLFYNGITHDWTDKVDFASMHFQRIGDYIHKAIDFKHNLDNEHNVSSWVKSHRHAVGEYIVPAPLPQNDMEVETLQCYFATAVMHSINSIWIPMVWAEGNDGSVDTSAELADRIYDSEVLDDTFGYVRIVSRISGDSHPPLAYTKASSDPLKFYNNIYSQFYKDMVSMMNSNYSRMLTCRCYLTACDIAETSMRDVVTIKGVKYHINAIREWTCEDEPCEVELIRL